MKRQASVPKDPFIRDWLGQSVKSVFSLVESDKQLYKFYQRFAEWQHWNFAGISRALEVSNSAVKYKGPSVVSYAQALVVGFQCLLQTAEIVVDHYDLNQTKDLETLKSEYREFHNDFNPSSDQP